MKNQCLRLKGADFTSYLCLEDATYPDIFFTNPGTTCIAELKHPLPHVCLERPHSRWIKLLSQHSPSSSPSPGRLEQAAPLLQPMAPLPGNLLAALTHLLPWPLSPWGPSSRAQTTLPSVPLFSAPVQCTPQQMHIILQNCIRNRTFVFNRFSFRVNRIKSPRTPKNTVMACRWSSLSWTLLSVD